MRPVTMFGVGAVTALLLAACGSDGDELSQEEFLAQANEICRVGNEEIEQVFDEFFAEFFEPLGEEPTEEEFREVIEEGQEPLDTLVSNVRGQIEDIRDLSGPSDLEDDLDPVLDEASEVLDGIADGSPEEFFEGEGDEFAEVNPQLEALGLTVCAEDGGGDEEFCAAAEELGSAFEEDPLEGDPEMLGERLDQAQSAIEAVADAAPDEISEEIDIFVVTAREIIDALRGIDPTDQDQVDAVFEEVFPDEEAGDEFDEAEAAVDAYVEEECGFVLPE